MDTTTEVSRKPRRSLTRTQLQTPAGVELLSLCQSVTSDGRVTEPEVAELRAWLERNRESGLPSEDFLAATVERILADGRITPDELEELHKALEVVLPPDLRRLAQEKRRVVAATDHRGPQASGARLQRLELLGEYDFMVAGGLYEGRADVVRELLNTNDPDSTVYLARDRGNPHSRNAVQVRLPDGRCIGFVPEWADDVRAREVARLLDGGARHRAFIKKILTGGRAPIVVVVAALFPANAVVEGAVTQPEVPHEPAASPWRGIGCVMLGAGLLGALVLMIARSF